MHMSYAPKLIAVSLLNGLAGTAEAVHLAVLGFSCELVEDPGGEVAAALERNLLPWSTQQVLVDRFDARLLLDCIPQPARQELLCYSIPNGRCYRVRTFQSIVHVPHVLKSVHAGLPKLADMAYDMLDGVRTLLQMTRQGLGCTQRAQGARPGRWG